MASSCRDRSCRASPLPPPYDKMEKPPIRKITEDQRKRMDASWTALWPSVLHPRQARKRKRPSWKISRRAEKTLLAKTTGHFFSRLSIPWNTASNARSALTLAPLCMASGKQEIYRPTLRPEILRRIISKYIKKAGALCQKLQGQRYRSELADYSPSGGTGLPLHAMPALRLRYARSAVDNGLINQRNTQNFLPGNGHRPQRDPRARDPCSSSGSVLPPG